MDLKMNHNDIISLHIMNEISLIDNGKRPRGKKGKKGSMYLK